MMITGTTKAVGLFGDPVEHSLSPRMQNAAFRAAHLDLCYLAFRVAPASLKDAMDGIRALGFLGANITIPHKVKALALVDEVSEEALRIGAINTVVNRDGRLVGFNTDAFGIVAALEREAGEKVAGKNIVLLGAGGAARACAHAFIEGGARLLVILNRTVEKAEELARDIALHARGTRVVVEKLPVIAMEMERVEKWLVGADLLVNATALGLSGNEESPLADLSKLPSECVVCDLVYHAGGTSLLRRARARGLRVVDGLSVLIYQGAKAFTLWTGLEAPVNAMKASLGMMPLEEAPPGATWR